MELEEGGLYRDSQLESGPIYYLWQTGFYEYTFIDLNNEKMGSFNISINNLFKYSFTKVGHLPPLSVIAKECYPELFI